MEERLRTARILASDDEEDEEHVARRRRTRTQIERDLNNPKVHKRIVENLYFAYKMRKERKKNYVSLFSFILFVCFYLTILFLQRKAGEAYRLTSTLNSVLIPQKKELTSSQEIIDWASGVVGTLWTDAICGDGVCSEPFEFPEYGRFGCKADCLRWIQRMNVTEVQLDLYYNFSHPRGSVNPVDLQADATWNLCPKEQDEITGIAKIRHGKDCYYETEQRFPAQSGQVQVLLTDVPDGRWAVQIKKDMFLKVGGAIRDRQNVTHEEKRHRVMLAHHYANVARKHQKKILEKLRVDFLDLGKGFAHKTLDELHETELTNLKAAHTEQFVIERADYGASYNLANIRGWYNSTVYNETILILNRTFANNHTLVDYASDPNLDCFPIMSDNSTGQYGVNTSHWNVDWWNNADGDTAEGADAPETTVFSRIQKGDLYIHPPYGLSYFCECDKHANGTVSGCLNKCVGNGVNGTFPDPNTLACTETYRFLRNVYEQGIADSWSILAGYETQALELADAEEADYMTAFEAQQNVEYYDMVKMEGTEGDAVATASYDILKTYILETEQAIGGKENAYSKLRYANSEKYPDHRNELVPFIEARINDLENRAQDVPVYDSPWINGNSTFKEPNPTVVEEIQKLYTAKTISGYHDVTTKLNYTLEEFNRKVVERKEYAYLTCNIEDRSDIYTGTCTDPSTVSGPKWWDPWTNGTSVWITQLRYKTMCNSICLCGGGTGAENNCNKDEVCVCEDCEDEGMFDTVEYLNATRDGQVGYGRKLLQAHEPNMQFRQKYRRAMLETAETTEAPAVTLDDIMSAVTAIAGNQTTLDTAMSELQKDQETATDKATAFFEDKRLEQMMTSGFEDLKSEHDALGEKLDEIVEKQKEALAAAQASLLIQQRTNELLEAQSKAIDKLDRAVEKQRLTIRDAWLSGAFKDMGTYIQIQEESIVSRQTRTKNAILMNAPCQMGPVDREFELENFENEDPAEAFRERYVGLSNRVVAGMLFYVKKKELNLCDNDRFADLDKFCPGDIDTSAYGVDPVFKLGTPMFNPDYDNVKTVTKIYNCTEIANPTYNLTVEGTDFRANEKPYCAELFNPRNISWGFHSMDISSSYKNGFPFLIDINLDAAGAQRWLDYMRYGLYLSDAQTDEVSAQIVVYNAELGYFGNTMVYFKYIDGGKIEVKYENQTIKVQYYENWQDMIRFAMEIALAVGAIYSVYDEFVDFIMTRKKNDGNWRAYFESVWNYIDVVSITIHLGVTVMWIIFSRVGCPRFDPSIHYKIYKNIDASAFQTKLFHDHEFTSLGNMFTDMYALVTFLQSYMAVSGINIILLMLRILKLMDFQPRLGVITHTLGLAAPDLIHFFTIFMMVFTGFAFIGHVIFGFGSVYFSTFEESFHTLFKNLLGDVEYFVVDLVELPGLTYVVAMIYFYSFNIMVLFILFNFLLAIIVDAFGEVKANASETISVHTELNPMISDSWRSFSKYFGFHRSHIPSAKLLAHLKRWRHGLDPDYESTDSDDDVIPYIPPGENVIRYDDDREIDQLGLRRVLRKAVIATETNRDPKFRLRSDPVGLEKDMDKVSKEISKQEGTYNNLENLRGIDTVEEIAGAAKLFIKQVGEQPKMLFEDDDDAKEDEIKTEGEALSEALEGMIKMQNKIVTSNRRIAVGNEEAQAAEARLHALEARLTRLMS
jgi:hypothetical protein